MENSPTLTRFLSSTHLLPILTPPSIHHHHDQLQRSQPIHPIQPSTTTGDSQSQLTCEWGMRNSFVCAVASS